jgi:HPt (histidine-containing phosphotransfer) domain-containing protein
MLKSLQQEYLASIPEKVLAIEMQIQKSDVNNVRESFHKLKGTGRTYGIPEVSDLAAVVEAVCIEHPVNGLAAAGMAIAILRDIYSQRKQHGAYNFATDKRFEDLRKLLQK